MNEKTIEFRKKVGEEFLKCLQEDPLVWRKGWKNQIPPFNAISNVAYRGVNRLYLSMISKLCGYTDPRFATYMQIQNKGWKLKDAKGTGIQIEYFFPWDVKEKKACTWEEYKEWENASAEERKEKNLIIKAKYYYVFNAKYIEGIPPLQIENKTTQIEISDLVERISKGMNVPIIHGGNDAYYSPKEDAIHMPPPESFVNSYEYNTTAFHEEAHASGATSRLNRGIGAMFGSIEYAREELVAEITSAFMSQHLQIDLAPDTLSGHKLENHKAYVQSWISIIQDKPEALMDAIKEADKAATYLETCAEIERENKIELFYEMISGRKITENEAMSFLSEQNWLKVDIQFDKKNQLIMNQIVSAKDGIWEAELVFTNEFKPEKVSQSSKFSHQVHTGIEIKIRQRNNPASEKKIELWKKGTTSVKAAQRNYINMLAQWKKVTGQDEILRNLRMPVVMEVER